MNGSAKEAAGKEAKPQANAAADQVSESSRAASRDGAKLEPVETRASQLEYPSTAKTVVIMLCLYISMFLVALDRTIIATAIPRITDEFHSIDVNLPIPLQI
jgi:hypothetical protein